jgi:hypothetical protein
MHAGASITTFSKSAATRYGSDLAAHSNASIHADSTSFSGGVAQSGASIYAYNNGTVTLKGCTVTAAKATVTEGGCIWAGAAATVSLVKSEVTNCRSAGTGGGMAVVGNATLVVTESNITGCNATQNGGGIWADERGRLVLDGARISGNAALEGGGFYLAANSTLMLLGTSHCQNNTAFMGGGLRLYSSGFHPDELSSRIVSRGNKASRGFNPDISMVPRNLQLVDKGNADNYIPTANTGDALHFTLNVSGPHGLPSDDDVYLILFDPVSNTNVFAEASRGETGKDLRDVNIRPKALPGD